MDVEKKLRLMNNLSSARKALQNSIKKYRLKQLGIEEQTNPLLLALEKIQLPNGQDVEMEQPLAPDEVPEEWKELKKIRNAKKEKGTLRFIEEKEGSRIYETGGKLFVVNNNMLLKNSEGKSVQLNSGLIELFFKSTPDETKYSHEDVKAYREFISDSGLILNLETQKQIKLSERPNTVVIPPTAEEQLERAKLLPASWREGHNDVFDEVNGLLKSLYENGKITQDEYQNVLKEITDGKSDS